MTMTNVTAVGPLAGSGPVPWSDIVELAVRAPSVHNSQPWLWVARGTSLQLHGDPSRLLPHVDPLGRTLTISCGAALHHARVAAAALGWELHVDRVPSDEPWHLATMTARPMRVTPEDEALLEALRERRTDRRPLTSWPVLPEVLTRISAEVAKWGAIVLPVIDLPRKWRIEDLMRRADEIQRADPVLMDELGQWRSRGSAADAHDGVPPSNLSSGDTSRLGWVPSRFDATLPEQWTGSGHELVVLLSLRDDREAWLSAGEALSALWLELTRRKMALMPLSQVAEVAETRARLARAVADPSVVPQMVLRVGWPPAGRIPVPHTPRRALSEVYVEKRSRRR
jgi:hypothetical protein